MKHRNHMLYFIFPFFFVILMSPTYYGSASLPQSFFINLTLEKSTDNIIIWFSNGSYSQVKIINLLFNASLIKEKKWEINFSVKTDNFYNSTKATATMVDGQFVINSVPSIFKISPRLLGQNCSIILTETSKFKLVGNVTSGSSLSPTGIDGNYVKDIVVQSFHVNNMGSETLPLVLGYDQDTGLLVYAGLTLSDVLLELVGIEYVVGNQFLLKSFSKNMSFELLHLNEESQSHLPPVIFVFITIPVVLSALVAIFYFNLKRNGRRSKTRASRKK